MLIGKLPVLRVEKTIGKYPAFRLKIPVGKHPVFRLEIPVDKYPVFRLEVPVDKYSVFRLEIPVDKYSVFRLEIPVDKYPVFCMEIPVVICLLFGMKMLLNLPQYCLCHHLPFAFIKKNQISVKYIIIPKPGVPVDNVFRKRCRLLSRCYLPVDVPDVWHLRAQPLFLRCPNKTALPAVLRDIFMAYR